MKSLVFKKVQTSKININKNITITAIFMLFCVLLYLKFPTNGIFQYRSVALIFLVILPYLYTKYIVKEKSFLEKINIGDWKKNVYWTLGSLVVALLFVALIFRFTNLLDHYPLPNAVKKNFWQFISYELLGTLFTVAIYEIFFRGFVMFYFEKIVGIWAILIQICLFFLMLFIIHIPFAFSYLFIIFVPFAGLIAYKSQSILYSFLGQLIFIIIADASAIALLMK